MSTADVSRAPVDRVAHIRTQGERRRLGRGIPVLLLCGLATLSFASSVAPAEGSVVTLVDYFDLGEREVDTALANADAAEGRITAELAERVARAVVRVRVQHGFRGDAHSTTHATGALLQGGAVVLTVAHELAAAREPDARIEIVLGDGRVLAGLRRPSEHFAPERPETDWACIDLVDPPADLAGLELGEAGDGERLVLGFPARSGRDAEGRVVLDDASAALPLQPLRILARTRTGDAAQLELAAGCVPIGGISGAPCVDARGRVVSIQRGVTETTRAGTSTWTLNVVALEGLRAALARPDRR